jgi:serine/threonine-protein kinase
MRNDIDRLTELLADRYRIERKLGEGGMATVYLAEDVRHGRNVALKVLKPELSAVIGAERFLVEIKTTANLQHPHILPLHDSGEVDGTVFYVMPYVQGESLRDRLERVKQLPIADAVRIATEVAGALDYAHRHDVVHRDIKPENILLNEEGMALVADFGIALAASKSEGSSRMTETGMSLGTPHYMSPEQAMGERTLDARTDEYALGCVLYEMLTGEPPFTGPTAQAVVARVMTEEPRGLSIQRKTVPPHVEATVIKALSKLPADRFESAKAFAEALAQPAFGTGLITAARPVARSAPQRAAGMVPWVIAVLAAAAAVWGWAGQSGTASPSRQYIALGDSLVPDPRSRPMSISADGEVLVFRDSTQAGLLWLKTRGELEPVSIAGTEGALQPAISPDGQWVAFIADGKLKKIRPAGGTAITLSDSADGGFGGVSWLDDNTLAFVGPTISTISTVPAAGGSGTIVMNAAFLNGFGMARPTPLPGGKGVLFVACASGCVIQDLYVQEFGAGDPIRLLQDAADAWILPNGDLFYIRRDGAALVAPFDLGTMKITGAAIPAVDGVALNNAGSVPQLAWSPSGRLIYRRGGDAQTVRREMLRVDRAGNAVAVDTAWKPAANSLALSPDGRRVAVGIGLTSGALGIWIKQLDTGPFSRLTFEGQDRRPTWSPDGKMVAFVRDSGNGGSVFVRRVDGSSTERELARLDRPVQEVTWSPDGAWVVMRTDNGAAGAGDLVAVRTDGDTTAVPLADSRFSEMHPAISPDGRWLAYTSDQTGTGEIYVRPFPGASDRQWQVSNGGGMLPKWSSDSRELYFINGSRLMAATVNATTGFEVSRITPLFGVSDYAIDIFHQSYDVLPGGGGFLFMQIPRSDRSAAPPVVEITNWFADLRQRTQE